jgi:hypothetical protein
MHDEYVQTYESTRRSIEQIVHTVRVRKFRQMFPLKQWGKGTKFYVISSEELDELERRAK